jgi:hypothetical protein
VEATRNDLWVKAHGYQAEQMKEAKLQGKYLHPELYGKTAAFGLRRDVSADVSQDAAYRRRAAMRAPEAGQADAAEPRGDDDQPPVGMPTEGIAATGE